MVIKSFERLIFSEVSATAELRRRRFSDKRSFCPACQRRPVYRLGTGRYRCGKCKYTFALTTGTWMGRCRLPARVWLWIIKLFELETTAHVAARQTGLSYPTALKAFTTIRRALLAMDQEGLELLRREVEADESYFGPRRSRGGKRGRGAPDKVPVFGLLERGGRVSVSVIHDISVRTLMDLTVKTVKRGSLIYTDKYRGYDSLMCCGYRHLRVDHGRDDATRFARRFSGSRFQR
jgi:transposase